MMGYIELTDAGYHFSREQRHQVPPGVKQNTMFFVYLHDQCLSPFSMTLNKACDFAESHYRRKETAHTARQYEYWNDHHMMAGEYKLTPAQQDIIGHSDDKP